MTEKQRMRRQERDRQLKRAVLKKTHGHCSYCGVMLVQDFEIDHLIPRSKGGSDELKNLVPACYRCNISKSDRFLDDWRIYIEKKIRMDRFQVIHLRKIDDKNGTLIDWIQFCRFTFWFEDNEIWEIEN